MSPSVIKRIVSRRPWKPLELVLDNGAVIRLTSPEVLVFRDAVVTSDRRGEMVLISPEAVSLIRPANGATRRPARA